MEQFKRMQKGRMIKCTLILHRFKVMVILHVASLPKDTIFQERGSCNGRGDHRVHMFRICLVV